MRVRVCLFVMFVVCACSDKPRSRDADSGDSIQATDGAAEGDASGEPADGSVAPSCAQACSGHGTCVEGACTCDTGYAGEACDECAAGFRLEPNSKVCSPVPCDGGVCETLPVESRTEQWGTAQGDQAYGVALGAAGEVLVVGGAGASLEGQMPLGNSDLFLTGRYGGSNATNNWSRQWGSAEFDFARGVVRADDGSVFVMGIAGGRVGVKHEGGVDAVLSKWRPDHTLAWTRQWGTIGSDQPQALSRDAAGNLFVAGWTDGDLEGKAAGGTDVFVTKLNPEGVVQWSAQWGGMGDDSGLGIALDDAGGIYVAGAIAMAADRNIFCRKLGPAGQEAWTANWGSNADDVGLDVAVGANGAVWVVGWSDGNLGGTGSGGAFLSRIEGTPGAVLWSEQFGATADDSAVSLAPLGDGGFFITGVTLGALKPGAHAGDEDVFVQRRDREGMLLSTAQMGTAGFDRVESSVATAEGALYVVGQTSGSFPGFKNRGSTDNFLLVLAP